MGDFLRVNAKRSFVEPWDIWMQTGIQNVRHAFGTEWQTRYMSAPIWRFTLSAGLAGPETTVGVMMPSVDRVGREFPLTLMASVQHPQSLLDLHFGTQDTFLALEDVALAALEDEMTRELLTGQLAQIPPPSPTFEKSDTPTSATEQIQTKRNPSIWTAELEQGPLMMICEGLPDATQMGALFDLNAAVWQSDPQMPETSV